MHGVKRYKQQKNGCVLHEESKDAAYDVFTGYLRLRMRNLNSYKVK